MPPTTSTTTNGTSSPQNLLSCIACKFCTRNVAQMSQHLQVHGCRVDGKLICKVEQKTAKEDGEQQTREAFIFGLMTLADVEEKNEADSSSVPKVRETEFEVGYKYMIKKS
jgi:hypothetical protein